MAVVVESRPELVGKRFLCVCGDEPPEKGRWRAGVIRTVSHRDSHSPELSVYVEFDDLEWEKREWVKVYEDFAAFLVEYQLVWAKRKDPSQTQGSKIKHIQWPALKNFKEPICTSLFQRNIEDFSAFALPFGFSVMPRVFRRTCRHQHLEHLGAIIDMRCCCLFMTKKKNKNRKDK